MPAVLTRLAALAALGLSAGLASAQPDLMPLPGGIPGVPLSAVRIDPVFSSALRSTGLDQPIQAVLTFDHYPTASELLAIRATGVQVRALRALPMVGVQGTGLQIRRLPALRGLRSVYFNRRLAYFLDESVPLIGANRVWNELGYTGKGVTVAVIDSGIDAIHRDLPFGPKVIQNVKLAPDLFGSGPLVLEGLSTTDKYRGVAIDSNLVGIGAGEALFILTALEGFDWILQNRLKYGIRVISNSWGAGGAFAPDDPVNVASRIAHDAGLVVVFAAGNDGPGLNTLSPYCVAPWVICAAAGGTSMATPYVSGIVALMLEANPALTPDQVKSALELTATPRPGYQQHEVGASYLNAYEAVSAVR
jgi:serine protease AprX